VDGKEAETAMSSVSAGDESSAKRHFALCSFWMLCVALPVIAYIQ